MIPDDETWCLGQNSATDKRVAEWPERAQLFTAAGYMLILEDLPEISAGLSVQGDFTHSLWCFNGGFFVEHGLSMGSADQTEGPLEIFTMRQLLPTVTWVLT
jgi:hypothetical protein